MKARLAATSLGISLLTAGPALADGSDTDVNPAQGGFGVNVEQTEYDNDHENFSSAGEPSIGTVDPADAVAAALTPELLLVLDCLEHLDQFIFIAPFCLDSAADEPPPAITPGLVAGAFARIPLPPSELVVQPPNGRTLVNFDTNFYTDSEPFTRSVTLLGQRVELDITPASYEWRFGDGKSTSTTSPGAAYPDLEITHNYLRKGRVAPSVDTTYTATYRVNDGPSQPVPGSVTIPGNPVPLQIVTAKPQLVG